jgi:lysozyme
MRRLVLLVAVAACAAEPEMPPKTGEVAQAAGVCADGTTVYGIDVSRFQGTIDWAKVANSGVKFAFIQISRSLTDIDAKFEFNWAGAKQNGILRGAYQRFHPGQDVNGQANIFLDKLGPFQDGDLPPVLDVEDADGLPAATIAARVKQWVDKVEPVVGVKPIIYTGFFFWRDMVGGADMSAYPLWVPNYSATCPLVPPAWTDWTIHQYSSTAMVPGITENTTDVNHFNGTIDQLKALGKPLRPCQVIEPTGGVVDDSSSCFVAGGTSGHVAL